MHEINFVRPYLKQIKEGPKTNPQKLLFLKLAGNCLWKGIGVIIVNPIIKIHYYILRYSVFYMLFREFKMSFQFC